MGSVIDIVFDREVTGYEGCDRYSLAEVYFEKKFDDLARRLGVAPLGDFYSDDPNKLDGDFDEDFFDDPAELERMKREMGPEEFFDPADALKSVTVLRDHLRDNPKELKKSPRRNKLVDELTEVEKTLNLAKSQGVKFHFVLTPD